MNLSDLRDERRVRIVAHPVRAFVGCVGELFRTPNGTWIVRDLHRGEEWIGGVVYVFARGCVVEAQGD